MFIPGRQSVVMPNGGLKFVPIKDFLQSRVAIQQTVEAD
jgi:hypothetical protein